MRANLLEIFDTKQLSLPPSALMPSRSLYPQTTDPALGSLTPLMVAEAMGHTAAALLLARGRADGLQH